MSGTQQVPNELSVDDDRWLGLELDTRFRIRQRIASGGMGAVYLADQLDVERLVVIKVIRDRYGGNDRLVTRFKAECRLLARLSHPNIVQIYATGEVNGDLWMAMEFVDGVTLADALAQHGRFDEARAVSVGAQIASALHAAHAAGIVHRDLKPANIMISRLPGGADHVKVLDFGIAHIREESALTAEHLTGTHEIVGTPAYMSPEQINGQPLDGRSDIYALGLVLYEMASGVHPFDAQTPLQWVMKHAQTPVPAFSERAPGAGVSNDYDEIVRRCLAKSADDRYPSAGALGDTLVDHLGGRHSTRPRPIAGMTTVLTSRSPTRGRGQWHHAALAIAALAVALLVALVAGYSLDALDEARSITASAPEAPSDGDGQAPDVDGSGESESARKESQRELARLHAAQELVRRQAETLERALARLNAATDRALTASVSASAGPVEADPDATLVRRGDLRLTRSDQTRGVPAPADAELISAMPNSITWRVAQPADRVMAAYDRQFAANSNVMISSSFEGHRSYRTGDDSHSWTLITIQGAGVFTMITALVRPEEPVPAPVVPAGRDVLRVDALGRMWFGDLQVRSDDREDWLVLPADATLEGATDSMTAWTVRRSLRELDALYEAVVPPLLLNLQIQGGHLHIDENVYGYEQLMWYFRDGGLLMVQQVDGAGLSRISLID